MFKSLRFWALAIAGASFVIPSHAGVFSENFTTNPALNGWQIFGNSNLFIWDSTNQNLRVTWDSAQSNSYFHRPLGTILGRDDDFSLQFDLHLSDIMSGNEPGKTGPLEIAIGFLNLETAKGTNFKRGVYYPFSQPDGAINLFEFDYFPSGEYDFGGTIFPVDPTTTPTFISRDGASYAPTIFAPYIFELPSNQTVRVTMTYTAGNQTLVTLLETNGATLVQLPNVVLTDTNASSFGATNDFRVDTLSISSYSSAGDDFDSVLAHGTIANLTLITPPPPVQNFTGALANGVWQAQFTSRSNWIYALERSGDLQSWLPASATTNGNGATVMLQDTNAPLDKAFYRVRAFRP